MEPLGILLPGWVGWNLETTRERAKSGSNSLSGGSSHLPLGYSRCPLPLPDSPLLSFPQGKRYKTSLETVGTPDSSRGRSEKKTIK